MLSGDWIVGHQLVTPAPDNSVECGAVYVARQQFDAQLGHFGIHPLRRVRIQRVHETGIPRFTVAVIAAGPGKFDQHQYFLGLHRLLMWPGYFVKRVSVAVGDLTCRDLEQQLFIEIGVINFYRSNRQERVIPVEGALFSNTLVDPRIDNSCQVTRSHGFQ